MTDNTKPEAMDLADWLEAVGGGPSAKRCAALLREQHARIAELESELEAIGAGGVSGPLMGIAALSANAGGPVAWLESEPSTKDWPVRNLFFGFTSFAYSSRLHMGEKPKGADQSQNRFTPLCVALSANAGEPRALNPRHIRKFLQALQAGEMSVSRAVEILDAWVGGYYEDEMVPLPPPDSCLIADDEFPMEIVRKLRSELAAAPPTAQAEGWISVDERLPEPGMPVLLDIGKKYPIRAMWAAKHTVQAADDDTDWGEYVEADDMYYAPEGWYEWNQCEDNHWRVTETPRAWVQLPPTSTEGVEHG